MILVGVLVFKSLKIFCVKNQNKPLITEYFPGNQGSEIVRVLGSCSVGSGHAFVLCSHGHCWKKQQTKVCKLYKNMFKPGKIRVSSNFWRSLRTWASWHRNSANWHLLNVNTPGGYSNYRPGLLKIITFLNLYDGNKNCSGQKRYCILILSSAGYLTLRHPWLFLIL